METAALEHIVIDEHGVAWIQAANTKVIEVVLDKVAHGWSPEEMARQHSHLSLAQIHAAMAYYYDHQAALDDEIERRYQTAETLRSKAGDSPIRRKLRLLGKL